MRHFWGAISSARTRSLVRPNQLGKQVDEIIVRAPTHQHPVRNMVEILKYYPKAIYWYESVDLASLTQLMVWDADFSWLAKGSVASLSNDQNVFYAILYYVICRLDDFKVFLFYGSPGSAPPLETALREQYSIESFCNWMRFTFLRAIGPFSHKIRFNVPREDQDPLADNSPWNLVYYRYPDSVRIWNTQFKRDVSEISVGQPLSWVPMRQYVKYRLDPDSVFISSELKHQARAQRFEISSRTRQISLITYLNIKKQEHWIVIMLPEGARKLFFWDPYNERVPFLEYWDKIDAQVQNSILQVLRGHNEGSVLVTEVQVFQLMTGRFTQLDTWTCGYRCLYFVSNLVGIMGAEFKPESMTQLVGNIVKNCLQLTLPGAGTQFMLVTPVSQGNLLLRGKMMRKKFSQFSVLEPIPGIDTAIQKHHNRRRKEMRRQLQQSSRVVVIDDQIQPRDKQVPHVPVRASMEMRFESASFNQKQQPRPQAVVKLRLPEGTSIIRRKTFDIPLVSQQVPAGSLHYRQLSHDADDVILMTDPKGCPYYPKHSLAVGVLHTGMSLFCGERHGAEGRKRGAPEQNLYPGPRVFGSKLPYSETDMLQVATRSKFIMKKNWLVTNKAYKDLPRAENLIFRSETVGSNNCYSVVNGEDQYSWTDTLLYNTQTIPFTPIINVNSPKIFHLGDQDQYEQIARFKTGKFPMTIQQINEIKMRGVFATSQLEAGTFVTTYSGDVTTASFVLSMNNSVFQLGNCGWDQIVVAPQLYSNVGRYFNSSRSEGLANLKLQPRFYKSKFVLSQNKSKGYVPVLLLLVMYTTRPVRAGEQLVWFYGQQYDKGMVEEQQVIHKPQEPQEDRIEMQLTIRDDYDPPQLRNYDQSEIHIDYNPQQEVSAPQNIMSIVEDETRKYRREPQPFSLPNILISQALRAQGLNQAQIKQVREPLVSQLSQDLQQQSKLNLQVSSKDDKVVPVRRRNQTLLEGDVPTKRLKRTLLQLFDDVRDFVPQDVNPTLTVSDLLQMNVRGERQPERNGEASEPQRRPLTPKPESPPPILQRQQSQKDQQQKKVFQLDSQPQVPPQRSLQDSSEPVRPIDREFAPSSDGQGQDWVIRRRGGLYGLAGPMLESAEAYARRPRTNQLPPIFRRQMILRWASFNVFPDSETSRHYKLAFSREIVDYVSTWGQERRLGLRQNRQIYEMNPTDYFDEEKEGQYWEWVRSSRANYKPGKRELKLTGTQGPYDMFRVDWMIETNFLKATSLFASFLVGAPAPDEIDADMAQQIESIIMPIWNHIALVVVKRKEITDLLEQWQRLGSIHPPEARPGARINYLREEVVVPIRNSGWNFANYMRDHFLGDIKMNFVVELDRDWIGHFMNTTITVVLPVSRMNQLRTMNLVDLHRWITESILLVIALMKDDLQSMVERYEKLIQYLYQIGETIVLFPQRAGVDQEQFGMDESGNYWQGRILRSNTRYNLHGAQSAMTADIDYVWRAQPMLIQRNDAMRAIFNRIMKSGRYTDVRWNVFSDEDFWKSCEDRKFVEWKEANSEEEDDCVKLLCQYLLGSANDSRIVVARHLGRVRSIMKILNRRTGYQCISHQPGTRRFQVVYPGSGQSCIAQFEGHLTIIDSDTYDALRFKNINPPVSDSAIMKRTSASKKMRVYEPAILSREENRFYPLVCPRLSPLFRRNSLFIDIECIDTSVQTPVSICVFGWLDCVEGTIKESFFSIDITDKPLKEFALWLAQRNNQMNVMEAKSKPKIKRQPIQVWTFNGNRYDLKYVIPQLVSIFGRIKTFGSLSQMKGMSINQNEIVFRDAVLICPGQSLKQACKTYNKFFQKDEIKGLGEVSNMKTWSDYKENMEAVVRYNFMDCLCTAELVERFYINLQTVYDQVLRQRQQRSLYSLRDLYLSIWTCPQVAMFFYKEVFIKEQFMFRKDSASDPLLDEQRRFYRGGLVEVFAPVYENKQLVKKKYRLFKYDLNSSYPYAMSSPLPFYFIGRNYDFPSPEQLKNSFQSGQYDTLFFRIKNLKFPKNKRCIPFIPVKRQGGLYYPRTITQQICVWGCELALAAKMGAQYTVVECHTYSDTRDGVKNTSIRDYVQFFYPKKSEQKDPAKKNLIKLLLNSLYGKFGQKPAEDYQFLEPSMSGDMPDEQQISNFIERGQYVEVCRSGKAPQGHIGNLVRLASFITSKARCTIIRYAMIAGANNVLYIDTDSLDVTQEGSRRLQASGLCDQKKLGALKLEKRIYEAIYLSRKNYMHLIDSEKGQGYDATWKAKGYNNKWDQQQRLEHFYLLKRKVKEIFTSKNKQNEEYFERYETMKALQVKSTPTHVSASCLRFITDKNGKGVSVQKYDKWINIVMKRTPRILRDGTMKYQPPEQYQLPAK